VTWSAKFDRRSACFKGSDDQDSDPTLESFDDWGIQGMASAVGSSGGLGIKNMIIKYLEPRLAGETNAVALK
jgi:hypothetical protein